MAVTGNNIQVESEKAKYVQPGYLGRTRERERYEIDALESVPRVRRPLLAQSKLRGLSSDCNDACRTGSNNRLHDLGPEPGTRAFIKRLG